MHLTSLHLRNYRVYRELDLEFPDGLVGVYGPNGSGKCLPGHVRLYDADAGGMVSISRFVRERRKHTFGLRGGRIQPVDVVDWICSGERPTVEVTLRNGTRVEVAATHPLLTDKGCVPAAELTPDHWVAQAAVVPPAGPCRLTVDEAMLLGLLLGDGSLQHTGVTLTAGTEEVAELFATVVASVIPGAEVASVASTGKVGTMARQYYVRSALDPVAKRARQSALVTRLFEVGVPLARYVGPTNISATIRGARGLSWDALCGIEQDLGVDLSEDRCQLYPARVLLEWVRGFGLVGATAGNKRVPADCLTLPDEQTWALLAGLWLTDGWLVITKGRAEVAIASKSRQLAGDIQALLLRVGVRTSLRNRSVAQREYWNVAVATDCLAALARMPLVGDKAARRDAIVGRPPPAHRGRLGDMIPPSFNDRIARWTSPTGANRGPKQRHHPMNRATYREFVGDGSVADEETVWSPVASVTPTGRSVMCYDLEIDSDEHLYLAESLVVHNSTLIEAIRYGIYGESRTAKDELRSSDVREDLRVTLRFEHEGNAYEVRRGLKGAALTPEVRVFCNNQLAVSSVRDANLYLTRVIGMTSQAFLASVCAQQKELTAFAGMQAAERRRLVLDLLGVSPVERALARVREAARAARAEAGGARQALLPLEGLERALDEAETELGGAGEAARTAAGAARAALARLEERRAATTRAADAARALAELRNAARLATAEAAQHREQAASHERRAADADLLLPLLRAAEERAAELPAATAAVQRLDAARAAQQERAALLRGVRDAAERLHTAERALAEAAREAEESQRLGDALATAEAALEAADAALTAARERHAEAQGTLTAARQHAALAAEAAEAAAALDPAAPCPTCGQELGGAFEAVRARRAEELRAARAEAARAEAALGELQREGTACRAERTRRAAARDQLRAGQQRAAKAAARAEAALAARSTAAGELAERQAALEELPDPGYDQAGHERAQELLAQTRQAVTELAEHRVRTARADEERSLAKQALARADEAEQRAAALESGAHELPRLEQELARARAAEQAAADEATGAHGASERAAAALAAAERRRTDRASALADGRAAHERVAALEEEAAYLERASDLVKGFRLHLVSRLGTRLSAEAARLFAELTDNEYADLEVDPEDYSVRIVDAGVAHELSRFSGSEHDLASLSLRVAISLVVAEGARELGLLVLDEVLGSLDRERRDRMLAALTALQGRFRQVLLVTHNEEVKDLLPAAIEVRKAGDRTSTAQVTR
jgi:DNA repair exonuclease SbcCD ATPase subunit